MTRCPWPSSPSVAVKEREVTVSQPPARVLLSVWAGHVATLTLNLRPTLATQQSKPRGISHAGALLRRGSRATTARECAHLTGSWSKDVHIDRHLHSPNARCRGRHLVLPATNPTVPIVELLSGRQVVRSPRA